MTTTKDSPTSFASLPVEIQTQILEMALPFPVCRYRHARSPPFYKRLTDPQTSMTNFLRDVHAIAFGCPFVIDILLRFCFQLDHDLWVQVKSWKPWGFPRCDSSGTHNELEYYQCKICGTKEALDILRALMSLKSRLWNLRSTLATLTWEKARKASLKRKQTRDDTLSAENEVAKKTKIDDEESC